MTLGTTDRHPWPTQSFPAQFPSFSRAVPICTAVETLIRVATNGVCVPLWLRPCIDIHRVLLRGLSPDPEKRFPSITELLSALNQEHHSSPRLDCPVCGPITELSPAHFLDDRRHSDVQDGAVRNDRDCRDTHRWYCNRLPKVFWLPLLYFCSLRC